MTGAGQQKVQKGLHSSFSAAPFKYYIHDTSSGYMLALSGAVLEASVAELSCCWQTAKTTLKNRRLTLDLRGVTFVDEVAKQWLASMSQEGAVYLPETFLRDLVAGTSKADAPQMPVKNKRGWLGWFSRPTPSGSTPIR